LLGVNKVYAAGTLTSFFNAKILISFALSYPISCAIIGLGTEEQVDGAMGKDLERYDRLKFSDVIARLEKDFMPIHCDRCQRCRCEYGTEIHLIFRQYNYFFLGKKYWALRKLDMNIRESAKLCRRCLRMTCLKMCPMGLDIPKIMQMIKELVEIHIRNGTVL